MFFRATSLSYNFLARASTDACLHEAGRVIYDAEALPKLRSVSWAPDECSTCSSWLDRLRRSCFSVYMSSICSLLRAIVGRRRNPDC